MLELFRTNSTLAKRTKRGEHVYILLVTLASLSPISLWVALLFTELFDFESVKQTQIAFSAGMLFIFAVDVLFTLLRFQTRTLIEPFHLSIFPIGYLQKLKFNLMIALVDHKSLLYLMIAFLFAVFFLKELSPLKALLGVVLILAFLLTMIVWFHITYSLCGDFFRRTKSNVLIIFHFGIFFFNVVLITKRLDIFGSLPLISHAGKALYALKTGDLQGALTNSLFLGLFLVSGITVLAFLATRRYGNPYPNNYSE